MAAELKTSLAERAPRGILSRGTGRPATRAHRRAGPALRAAWVLVLAFPFIFLLFASVGPLVDQAFGSFFNWYDIHPASFAGFHYYGEVLSDPMASAAIVHTAVYVAITVPIEVLLGVGGAWLVYRARRGQAALTALFVLPLVIPWSSTATLFSGLLSADNGFDGFVNHLIGDTYPLVWDINPRLGFGVIVFVGIWKGAPWCFLLMLAAFSTAPAQQFEAGRVDGAGGLAYWRYVVIPAVWPMLVFVTVFRLFTEAQMAQSVDLLTQGGPFGETQLIGSYANDLAFTSFRFAESEALATATGALVLVLALLALAFVYRPKPALVPLGRTTGPPRRTVPGQASDDDEAATRPDTFGPEGRQRQRRRAFLIDWAGTSKRRTRRIAAVALFVAGVIELVPLAGALPRGALGPVFRLAWPEVVTGLVNSAIMTAGTVAGVLLLAVPAAYALAQGRFPGRSVLFGLVLVAIAVPGALTLFPQARGLVWLGLINTRLGVMLIYIALDLPLAIFFLRAAFAAVPKPLVEAMRVDGASTARIATRLFLPLSVSTIIVVVVLTVLQVWNDSLIMIVMTNSSSLYTLPVLVASGLGGTAVLGASWLSIAPPLLVFLASQRHFLRGVAPAPLL
ncbi:MAG TPA: ABC transporter permease subunit [Acidimicrobiales bacterium]|nr:ABC transporter permease subunit [Acidimicrobiales bacterium]